MTWLRQQHARCCCSWNETISCHALHSWNQPPLVPAVKVPLHRSSLLQLSSLLQHNKLLLHSSPLLLSQHATRRLGGGQGGQGLLSHRKVLPYCRNQLDPMDIFNWVCVGGNDLSNVPDIPWDICRGYPGRDLVKLMRTLASTVFVYKVLP
ncbi:hypothetical protein HPB47_018197 [Ixodes persulcatus]|uniref:Uncharacterized protein n=1 Tax=Ixodes persulcatus TaxID=34615 RepID=A0AC60QNL5_IXOPE|nr:hypothetical protein HPB47_018197 [Ixodes persulcatus]